VKLLVLLPSELAEAHTVDRVLRLDLDALLRRPFADLVKLEADMPGGPSLHRIRYDLPEYGIRTVRAVAWLALREAGATVDYPSFDTDFSQCTYQHEVGKQADADPPARGGGSPEEPAKTSSSRSGRRSRTSTTSRRTA